LEKLQNITAKQGTLSPSILHYTMHWNGEKQHINLVS